MRTNTCTLSKQSLNLYPEVPAPGSGQGCVPPVSYLNTKQDSNKLEKINILKALGKESEERWVSVSGIRSADRSNR